ncbi:tRNA (adenosine(37)-N6)-threonylcarbamoyltransferase complex transferase subunit TsaD [bacterium]|nr:tRNA (adenosine(37)-N6)-threonylcarbamoyltransferase complex transferase subunit TsaD [bacterium]MDB4786819.1 tRNA (adenosine(37)-N6)-threonylcarbamoyltransferase complex transferase subunit TsaD [Planctomycetaceae bacterium]
MTLSRTLLAIESSCDETAAAIIREDGKVLSSVVASQASLHEKFGGVVPEVASRAHLETILPVIDKAVKDAQLTLSDLSAIAVMTEPGLVGSLLVGLTAAKALSWSLGIPLIPLNHIEAHIYACEMQTDQSIFPCVGFVVSGGHSNLYDCQSAIEFRLLGSTIDDAAGEAFDKVARILGLPYPGGPAVAKLASQGDPKAIEFPRPLRHDKRLAFSFSGLKTAVMYEAFGVPGSHKPVPELTDLRRANIAASFQAAVIDVLVSKCEQALKQSNHNTLCIGGGVACNRMLRERLVKSSQQLGYRLEMAPGDLCTDNAAMGAIAWQLFAANRFAELDLDVRPGLVRAGG